MWDDWTAAARRRHRAARSAATRYLCFAAQTDEDFAAAVVHALLWERQRHVAPSYGIDILPILRHCLHAQRRHTLRDLMLLLLLMTEAAICIRAAMSALAPLRHVRLTTTAGSLLNAGAVKQQLLLLVSVVVPLLLAGAVRAGDWAWGRMVVGGRLVARRFDPDSDRILLLPWTRKRMRLIGREQYGHLTVYDASSPTPFVGAGPLIARGSWSFALDLRRKAEDPLGSSTDVINFRPLELYEYVQEQVLALRNPGLGRAYVLPDLEVSDHLFVSGLTPPALLPLADRMDGDAPTPEAVNRITDVPEGLIRHFKCVQVESWGGELVVTAFVHLGTQGSTLYVEFTPCLLPPIRGRYHAPDTQPLPRPGEWLYESAMAWLGAPAAVVGAPKRLVVRWLGGPVEENDDHDPEERHSPPDRGARTSIRLLGADREPRHHFQWLDARKYQQVIELQVLNAIIEFLDSRHIDTSELRARQNTILNQGVIVSQSTVDHVAMAVGDDARASVAGAGSTRSATPPAAPSSPGGST